ESVRAVLDDYQPVPACDSQDGLDIARLTEGVLQQYSFRPLSDGFLDAFGLNIESLFGDVHIERLGATIDDGIGNYHTCIGRDDDLITIFNIDCLQDRIQSHPSCAKTDCIRYACILSSSVFVTLNPILSVGF